MRNKIGIIVAVIIITCTSVQSLHSQNPASKTIGTEIGNLAPEIALKDPNGNPHKLSDLRGNVVLIDFWASWCQPCRRENPTVVKAYNKFKDKKFGEARGFRIFSVSLDKTQTDWVNAIEKDQLVWKEHVSDLQGWKSYMAKLYNVRSIPMNFLIDKDGIIIDKNLRGENLEKALDKLAN